MDTFLADLRMKAWRTAGARYNAARRLARRAWLSMSSLALLSAISIALAFVQRVYSPASGAPLNNYLSTLAVVVGVLLLVVSLLEWGAGYGVRAESLHRNAEQLTAFQIKMAQTIALVDSGTSATTEMIDELRLEYEGIKDKCTTNHLPRDDALFRAQHRCDKEFQSEGKPRMGHFEVFLAYFAWNLSEIWFFTLIWSLVLGALLYSFYIPVS